MGRRDRSNEQRIKIKLGGQVCEWGRRTARMWLPETGKSNVPTIVL